MESNAGIVLDQKRLNALKQTIYLMERENHKTKKFRDKDMVERIIKRIREGVDKDAD